MTASRLTTSFKYACPISSDEDLLNSKSCDKILHHENRAWALNKLPEDSRRPIGTVSVLPVLSKAGLHIQTGTYFQSAQ